jgi:hypothetical protein
VRKYARAWASEPVDRGVVVDACDVCDGGGVVVVDVVVGVVVV